MMNEDPVKWLEEYGDYLFGFARSRVHNEALAEDLVQETLLAALESRRSFDGKSSLKTWLTGILKHKIVDHYRRASRSAASEAAQTSADLFDEAGFWREYPADWRTTPEALLEEKEFREILSSCLAELPPNLAAVFTLCEIEGLKSREVCALLELTPANFWVLLHRARLQLRQGLEKRWFERKTPVPRPDRAGALAFSN